MSEKAIAVDLYNQVLTGDICMTLRQKAADSDHIPCVMIRQDEPIAFSAVQINGRKKENSTPDI